MNCIPLQGPEVHPVLRCDVAHVCNHFAAYICTDILEYSKHRILLLFSELSVHRHTSCSQRSSQVSIIIV